MYWNLISLIDIKLYQAVDLADHQQPQLIEF
nr:MAG TPA: hypothetical protein [Crassvirales sp.]